MIPQFMIHEESVPGFNVVARVREEKGEDARSVACRTMLGCWFSASSRSLGMICRSFPAHQDGTPVYNSIATVLDTRHATAFFNQKERNSESKGKWTVLKDPATLQHRCPTGVTFANQLPAIPLT